MLNLNGTDITKPKKFDKFGFSPRSMENEPNVAVIGSVFQRYPPAFHAQKLFFFTCNFPNFRTEVCINLVFHTRSNKNIIS